LVQVETLESADDTREETSKKYQSAPKKKINGGSWGSGTAIGSVCYQFDTGYGRMFGAKKRCHTVILTAAHVVEDKTYTKIHWMEKTMPGHVFAKDDQLDLALIEVPWELPTAELFFGPLVIFEQSCVAGYPFKLGPKLTCGYVGPISHENNDLQQDSASVWPGNSGGGVFVIRHGKWVVAGVTDAIHVGVVADVIVVADTVSFFVHMQKVKEFFHKSGVF
jgi:S1-C subfamily serine protease